MPSLNDAVNPYSAGSAITGSEPSTNAGGGQNYFNLLNGTGSQGPVTQGQLQGYQSKFLGGLNTGTLNTAGTFDPTTGLSKGDYGLYLQRNNQVAGLGQVPQLNYGGTVNGSQSLQDMINARQPILDQTTQSLNQLEDQSGISDQFTQGLQPTGLSRMALIGRLQAQFGNAWHQNDQAKGILDQFDSIYNQGQDLQTLNNLIDQGKTAMDFLNSPPSQTTFNLIQKLGGQTISNTALDSSYSGLAASDPNKFLSMFTSGQAPEDRKSVV